MTLFSRTRLMIAGLIAAASLSLAPAALAQDFRGGGSISEFTNCEEQGWSGPQMIRARMRLAATASNGMNALSLFLTDGTVTLTIPDPLAPGGTWRRIWGGAVWDEPGGWDPRPRVRIRNVFVIGGATPAEAEDLLIRLRVRGFNWMPYCEATVVLALTRN
ncbi:MAG: hypothetical protein LCH92_17445 [Proteobacteria bacterium]|nr:hypothetical protein [Pseudomonadota bacterium]